MKKIYLFLLCGFLLPFVTKAQVVINEVYGGGGNTGALYKSDFIELYNTSSSPVSINGWSIQYAASTGTNWQKTDLSGTIPANGYFLIKQATGNTGGTLDLPTPDITGSIPMAAGAGKVALVNNNTLITSGPAGVGISCPTGPHIVDFVGFGGANCFEGTGPTPAPSNTASVQRKSPGFDTQNNAADFELINPPTPTASASGSVPVTDVTAPLFSSLSPADNATNIATSFAATITFNEPIAKGTGSILVKRSSDNSVVQTINLSAVTTSGSTATFDVTGLALNTAYYIEVPAGTFKDAANNNFAGITGSTAWNFTTSATPPTGTLGTTYNFNTCSSAFPNGFTQYSVLGEQVWACTTFGRTGNAVQINGFAGGTNVPNEDWFITPPYDLTGTTYPLLSFWSRTAFNGDPLKLKVSTDYSGTGDPSLATWTDLNGRFPNQASDVWTLSDNIDLSAYKGQKVYIAFVYYSSEDDGARWTLDDITVINSATPPPPSITTSTTDIQFPFVANGATGDRTFTFAGNNITGDITLATTGNFQLSKDGSTFSNSITFTQAEANNTEKTVTVRFSPNQPNQNFEGSISIASSGLTSPINLKGSSIDPATTLEVVNWNIEWFGSTSLGPTNETQQEQNVKNILQSVNADIYGLVEVVDEAKLASVVSQLPGYAYVVGQFGSHATTPAGLATAQKLAFVYKTSVFSNVSARQLIQNTSAESYNNWSSGRFPYLLTADVTLNCVTKTMNFVLIHAKANTSPTRTSYERREASARELHDTLEQYFADANVIVLGDFNDDLDRSITAGFTTTSYSSFTNDPADFFSPTLALSLADKKSTVSYNDVIDHVIITNEVVPYYMENSASILTDVTTLVSGSYGTSTSDHYPVFTRYQFEQPAPPTITSCPTVAPFCVSGSNEYTIPAFAATSNCGAISYSYTITGATTRTGTGNNASGIFNQGTSTITWTATDGLGNTSTCTTTVIVNANPAVSIPDASVLPSGVLANTVYIGYAPASAITLTANATGGPSPYTYSWSTGSTASATTVSPTVSTTYSVTATDANGCTATAAKQVNVIDARAGKKLDKVAVCHKPGKQMNTLEIASSAVADHLSHGDMLGSCSQAGLMVRNQASNANDGARLESMATEFKVYASPNPSANHFVLSIQGAENERVSLKVTDLLGRVVEQKNNVQSNQILKIGADYRPGIYLVELIQGPERQQVKLLKTGN